MWRAPPQHFGHEAKRVEIAASSSLKGVNSILEAQILTVNNDEGVEKASRPAFLLLKLGRFVKSVGGRSDRNGL